MSLYACNLAPVVATDIFWSLVIIGCEFQFPINFCTDFHWIITSNPTRVTNYESDQARLLLCTRAIDRKLIHHHRIYACEYINSHFSNTRLYSYGNMLFAKRAVKYDKQQVPVVKLMNSFTGPCWVTKSLHSISYKLVHCNTYRPENRHSDHLSPFPQELIPFQPVNGDDIYFGQMYAPIQAHPYEESGIKVFTPTEPLKSASHLYGISSTP